MKDNFSARAAGYAKYRPVYPPALFSFILQHVPRSQNAWDCATGNGQAARNLATSFETVYATDISQQQLDNAEEKPNIFYSRQPAEQTDFPTGFFDLVTVAQALHWLDLPAFYKEVNRTTRHGGILAVWVYGLLQIDPQIDPYIQELYKDVLGGYWDGERKKVDNLYVDIDFPFEQIPAPPFAMEFSWTLEELEGYFNTWSGLQHYLRDNHPHPVPGILEKMKPYWLSEKMPVRFPIRLILGRIKK